MIDQTWKSFNTKFGHQWKIRKSSYQARQILALFVNSVALILVWNCVNDFRVTKIARRLKFIFRDYQGQNIWDKLYVTCDIAHYE